MKDYMRALHQYFFREPECQNLREEMETLRFSLREKLERQDREKLLNLIDLGMALQEEISLAAFAEGFRVAFGIAMELKPYSFEDDEEQRACEAAEKTLQK